MVLYDNRREAPIVKVCVLASSSSGNSTFVATSRTRILVDAGLSRSQTFERLCAIGESPEHLNGILISHEHTDHIAGLPAIVKKLGIPVYVSSLAAEALDWQDARPRLVTFQSGTSLEIGDIGVATFTVPHDAIDPVGFVLCGEGVRAGIVTDLGYVPDSLRIHLAGTDLLLLESNHDLEMLKVGPYPWSLKQRVMSRKGHLSNEVASRFIADGMDSTVSTLVLGHLSEQNNHPELVRLMARQALESRNLATRLIVAAPRKQTEAFEY